MNIIKNADGRIISQTHNLRAVHRHSGKHRATSVFFSGEVFPNGEGDFTNLTILFDDDSVFISKWECYETLKYHIRHWLNLRGADLFISWTRRGKVEYHNTHLDCPSLIIRKSRQKG